MKRSHLNLALLAVVAGLGAAVWFGQKKEEKGPPLTALKQDAITRIALQHPGKATVRLEKKDAKWSLVEPVQAPADPFEVNGILGLAEMEMKARLKASEVNRRELGLDLPAYTVSLDDQTLAVGGVEPIKYRRYVQSGDTVALIDDPPSAALDADFSDLVTRLVVPENAELSRIELPGLTLEKKPDGAWASPQQAQATSAQLAQLAEGWKDARAMWNAMETEAEPKGDGVTLTLNDGRTVALRVVERDPQLVLSNPALKLRYTLSKVLATDLFQVPAEKKSEVPTEAGTPSPDTAKKP
jgi:hypothetical protein